MYRKMIISKQGQEPMKVHYEAGGKCIDNKEYEDFFSHFTPNFDFSLVDKITQDFSKDIVPSFKNSKYFTNDDLKNLVRPFKDDYVIERPTKKDPLTYFNPKTRRHHKKKRNNNNKNKNKNKNKNNKNIRKSKKNKTKKNGNKKSGNKKSGNKK